MGHKGTTTDLHGQVQWALSGLPVLKKLHWYHTWKVFILVIIPYQYHNCLHSNYIVLDIISNLEMI